LRLSPDDLEDLLDQLRRQAHRGLIEQIMVGRAMRLADAVICCSPPDVCGLRMGRS